MDRLTVTADTNIYISALQFDGRPDQVLGLARNHFIRLAVSEPIISEIQRVLRDKFRRDAGELAEADQLIRAFTELVHPTRQIEAVPGDRDDDRILECAVASGSQFLVSGDRHLLRLGEFEGIHIVPASTFMERYFPAPPPRDHIG